MCKTHNDVMMNRLPLCVSELEVCLDQGTKRTQLSLLRAIALGAIF
jgi:hypothetical protein